MPAGTNAMAVALVLLCAGTLVSRGSGGHDGLLTHGLWMLLTFAVALSWGVRWQKRARHLQQQEAAQQHRMGTLEHDLRTALAELHHRTVSHNKELP